MRSKKIDMLRTVAAFSVVVLHVTSIYYILNSGQKGPSLIISAFFNGIIRPSSTLIFVLISGALLLNNSSNKIYRAFYRKCFSNILSPVFIWSIFYIIFKLIMNSSDGLFPSSIQYKGVIIDWILGVPYYHLWYMYMILGIYSVVPIILRLKERLDRNIYLAISISLYVLGIFIELIGLKLLWPLHWFQFVGVFLLGDILYKYTSGNIRKLSFTYILIALVNVVLIISVDLAMVHVSLTPAYFQHSMSILSSLGSLVLFKLIVSIEVKKDFSRGANASFIVYLIHPFFISLSHIFVTQMGMQWIYKSGYWLLVFIPINMFIIYIASHYTAERITIIKRAKLLRVKSFKA